MSTQSDIEKMQREIDELRKAVLVKRYGIGTSPVIVVLQGETPQQAIDRRLAHVPENLRGQINAKTVSMPWLTGRKVGATPESVEEAY